MQFINEWLLISTRIVAALCLVSGFLSPRAQAGEVVLEDNSVRVAFDADSAALTRFEDKSGHWIIERRPELGVSFRLFAPLPHRRYNPVFGQKQRAVEVKKISANEIEFQWQNLVSENGGVLRMILTAEVTLTNGSLTFGGTLKNNSSLTVETIDYPYFGDFNPPSRDSSLAAQTVGNGGVDHLQTNEVYPHFRNEKGYWGVNYPTKTLEAQPSRFCLIQAPGEGLYAQIDKPGMAYRLQYTFELHPGLLSTANNLVPPGDEISGFPVHLEFRFCHFVFAPPNSKMTLTPIVLRCYRGSWQNGVDLYQRWRSMLPH
jgi:hypothetical protein